MKFHFNHVLVILGRLRVEIIAGGRGHISERNASRCIQPDIRMDQRNVRPHLRPRVVPAAHVEHNSGAQRGIGPSNDNAVHRSGEQ
jgi:hypothetical protein